MEKILQVIKEPLIWVGVSIVAGIVGKKIADKYKGLLYFLITAIEAYDEMVADIIPDTVLQNKKYIRIKKIVARLLPLSMKKQIDKLLDNLGYLKQSEGNKGYIIKDGKPTITN